MVSRKIRGIPLTRLRRGQSGRIVGLSPSRQADLQKLITLGLFPGERVIILHHKPLHVVQVGYTQIALDRQGAGSIIVQPE